MKSHLYHIVSALILCALALAGYGALYAAISSKSAEAADLQTAIQEKTNAASRIASAQDALAQIADDEAIVESYFVPETGIVSFIDDLQARGSSLGTTVSVSSVETAGTEVPVLLLTLTSKGSFDAVMRTIGAIEYAPYDLSISEFSLGLDAKDNWHANFKLRVGSVPAATSTPAAPAGTRTSARVVPPSSHAYF